MNSSKFIKSLCTLGPIGYLPAPGTAGSICAIPLVLLLKYFFSPFWYAVITALSIYLVIKAVEIIQSYFVQQDPSQIIIDEVVGMLVTFLFVTPTPSNLIVGFLLFRFFDIAKCWPIYKCEFPNALGIVTDDVAAGAISAVILGLLHLA